MPAPGVGRSIGRFDSLFAAQSRWFASVGAAYADTRANVPINGGRVGGGAGHTLVGLVGDGRRDHFSGRGTRRTCRSAPFVEVSNP